MSGFTAREAIGQSITIILPSDRLHEETDVIARIRRGERIEHFETVRQRKDGRPVPISLSMSPVRDEGFHAHLAKPVDPLDLVREAARIAGRS